MALDEAAMAALVKANIEALSNTPNSGDSPVFVSDDVLVAFCKGIVDHIKASAVVNTTGTVTSGAGIGGSTVATGTVT